MIYNIGTLDKVKEMNEEEEYIVLHDILHPQSIANYFDKAKVLEILKNNSTRFEEHDVFELICFHRIAQNDKNLQMIYIFLNDKCVHIIGDLTYLKTLIEHEMIENKHVIHHIGGFLHLFLSLIVKEYQTDLERMELEIFGLEDKVLDGLDDKLHPKEILYYRKHLLYKKREYEQLQDILDEILENDHDFYLENELPKFKILSDKITRVYSHVTALLEYVTEIREAYQSAMDIKQNNIMQILTIVSAIFLPLTLIVGWYGMNFRMPEFQSSYSYPIVICLCITIVVGCIMYFKKKKWF